MDPNAQESLLLWENITVHVWREKKDPHHFKECFRREVLSAIGGWEQGLPTPPEAPCFLKTWQEYQSKGGHCPAGCKSIYWCSLLCLDGLDLEWPLQGTKSISHLPFWPSTSHWLSFSQRENPSVLILILCLVLHFNRRGRLGSLGLTWEQWPTVSIEVRLLSDQCP